MIAHSPYPPDPRIAREIRVALREGYEVDVFAMQQRGQPAVEMVEGAHVYRLPLVHRRGRGLLAVVPEYLGFTLLALARVAVRGLRHRYSIVQIHNPPDFLVVSAIVPKLLGARLILDVHDLSPDMYSMRFGDRTGAGTIERALRVIERAATAFVDAVLTVHEPYRRELVTRGVRSEKIRVVMNSYDGPVAQQAIDPIPLDPLRIVYHGTITPHYGTTLLIEAVARVRADVQNVALEIYGEGDALPEARQLAAELGIADVVHFSGRFLPHKAVVEKIKSASVGVVPNLPIKLNRFALSSKLLEYVAVGLPAVCANLPTLREHFSEEEILFFQAADPESLAAALREVASDPARASQRAEAALRRYRRDYAWAVSARNYAAVLQQLNRNGLSVPSRTFPRSGSGGDGDTAAFGRRGFGRSH